MTTFTLPLPDDLAAALNAIPETERNNYAVALMREGLAVRESEDSAETEADPEVIEALQESLKETRAGQVWTIEEMDAAFEARFSQLKDGLEA